MTKACDIPQGISHGEGANLDWRLVPYHGKCKRIQSRIEVIFLAIFVTENSRQKILNLFISCLYLLAEVFIKAMKVFSNFLFAASKVKFQQHFLTIVISSPLARREVPVEGRRPEGEGAHIDRHLVPYHGKMKCKRIQSRIEFIPSLGAKRRPQAEGLRARVLISTGV